MNCPWWPYLLAEWDEMKKLYRGPYIDAFCQVWFHLAQLFQRSRLKYEKVNGRKTDDGRTTDAKWWQYLTWPFGSGELKMRSRSRGMCLTDIHPCKKYPETRLYGNIESDLITKTWKVIPIFCLQRLSAIVQAIQ